MSLMTSHANDLGDESSHGKSRASRIRDQKSNILEKQFLSNILK